MSMIDIPTKDIRKMSDEELASAIEALGRSRYEQVADEIVGRIMAEQLRRAKVKEVKP